MKETKAILSSMKIILAVRILVHLQQRKPHSMSSFSTQSLPDMKPIYESIWSPTLMYNIGFCLILIGSIMLLLAWVKSKKIR